MQKMPYLHTRQNSTVHVRHCCLNRTAISVRTVIMIGVMTTAKTVPRFKAVTTNQTRSTVHCDVPCDTRYMVITSLMLALQQTCAYISNWHHLLSATWQTDLVLCMQTGLHIF